jgi:hypothetical protein
MPQEILSLLRRAHDLSQGGHCIECARVIITALHMMCNPNETSSAQNLPAQLQKEQLKNSLAQLLR